jgi:hypothetical protein
MYLSRFRAYRIALQPQAKTYEGSGPQTDKHLPPIFKKRQPLGFGVFIVLWLMAHGFGSWLMARNGKLWGVREGGVRQIRRQKKGWASSGTIFPLQPCQLITNVIPLSQRMICEIVTFM